MINSSRRVTLAQVAEHAGVSTMTASYTFSRPERVSAASREKVLTAARALGYAGPDPSARSLRRGKAGALGVVLGEHLTYAFDDPQATAFLAGVAEVCAEQGQAMTILPVTDASTDGARISAAAVDGYVLWTMEDGAPVLDAAIATGRPVVVHGGPPAAGARVVGIDNRAAARDIGRLVFAAATTPAVLSFPLTGARGAAILAGPDPHRATFPVTRERLLGFRDAAGDVGANWADVLVAVCSTNDAREAQTMATDLLSRDRRPDALATMSDELASGALRALAAAGLHVPSAVAVTGWDDADAARTLGITTVAQSMREQGAACAQQALTQTSIDFTDQWQIIERASTHPAGPNP
ncbi:LacI family DNA-binding transcriptional regulator [Saxibacter everestensis]|uniref:LacI family DNA-binding transcriptional regulator n=1 Tax=Saxibacter everestensis TaxID=2909229 RepID=A0ABY8QZR6_9MICO|nr:LacI family DNA-binding transcriptional regulator [Brevibacteriaceae bacterium ZFBP1038]